jgi:pimeloyl-ACP methyl ester carboxylesterase
MPYAENDGASIYWEEQGRGEPVLLIMGLGSTLDLWYRLLPSLSASYRAILLDNRGVGRTGAPEPPYSIPQWPMTRRRYSMRRPSKRRT